MANRVVNIELHSEYCGNCAVCAGRQIGVNDERERLIAAFVERYPNHNVEVIDRGMGETYKSHDNCAQCVAIALIKGDN
jgi:hypothetical protein